MSNRLRLKPAEWPLGDQQLWAEAQKPPGFLEAPKPASQWSPKRCAIVELSYGYWLGWLSRHGHLVPQQDPGERATQELVLQYITDLRARVAPESVSMMVGALVRMLQALAPHKDWDWLQRLYAHAKRTARPQRPRTAHAVPPEQLFDLGLHLMGSPCPSKRASEFHHSTRYRDGLIIATLISCPIRISNLEQIEIGTHLRFDTDRYWLSFPAEETKTREPVMGDLPPSLTPWIEEYLKVHRPMLLARGKGAATRRLWLDNAGKPMTERAIRDQLNERTRSAFGRNVWPHLFRHCAVTGLVDFAPEQIAIAPDLLGHSSLQTTQKHYILARGTRAHQAVQKSLSDARQEARRRLGRSGR
jgi:site-specific recombinase XerD